MLSQFFRDAYISTLLLLYQICSLKCVSWTYKKYTYRPFTLQKQAHRKRNQVCGYQRQKWVRGNWMRAIRRYKFPVILNSRNVVYNLNYMINVINTAVCYIWKVLKEQILRVFITREKTFFSILYICEIMGFPDGSVGKESACSAGDTGDVGSIPGLGRSPGEGTNYPLQYSCLENPMDRGAWPVTVYGVAKSRTWLCTKHMSW